MLKIKKILECLFCESELDKPMRIMRGGRVSFCDSCAEKLEEKGLLRKNHDGTVKLMKPLLDVIGEF